MSKKSALPSKATDHYSNILLLAPDDQPLATIPAKRARWYWNRGLVETMPDREGYNEVLRLLVQPKGRPRKHVEPLENRCVVCGQTEDLSCHHVVPRAIRMHFDPKDKEHASNWCVLLCEEHHLAAELLARSLYEKFLQIAVSNAHQHYTKLCYNIIKEAIRGGQKHGEIDLSEHKAARKAAVKEAHREQAQSLIDALGGVEGTKDIFRRKFMELEPKYLPEGFLTDDWNK